jgi:hypothetical protein
LEDPTPPDEAVVSAMEGVGKMLSAPEADASRADVPRDLRWRCDQLQFKTVAHAATAMLETIGIPISIGRNP